MEIHIFKNLAQMEPLNVLPQLDEIFFDHVQRKDVLFKELIPKEFFKQNGAGIDP